MDDPAPTTVSSRCSGYAINRTRVTRISDIILSQLGLSGVELAVGFVDNQAIQELNRDFRGKDKPTDVLSFPQMQFSPALTPKAPRQPVPKKSRRALSAPPEALGDVVIAPRVAEVNAAKIGQSLDRELCFLLVHGILHLAGHDHEKADEEALMLAAQREIMAHLESVVAQSPRSRRPIWEGIVRQTASRKSASSSQEGPG